MKTLEWYKLECEEKAHKVTNRLILDFWKLKIKLKNKKKRILSIVQHSGQRKDNESSEAKNYPPEQNKKKEKAEFKHTKHWNISQKNGQKKQLLRPHLW